MPITVVCDCGKSMAVPDHFAGNLERCRECGTAIEVPDLRRLASRTVSAPPAAPIDPLDGGAETCLPVVPPPKSRADVESIVPVVVPASNPGPDTGYFFYGIVLIAFVSALASLTGNKIAMLCFTVASIGLVVIPTSRIEATASRPAVPASSSRETVKAILATMVICVVLWAIFYLV